MNKITTQFSINDLENLSGIKAHTIRIWEKRYKLLEPARTDSNIRFYDTTNLQKLLNVVTLYQAGNKISKIAELSPDHLKNMVQQLGIGKHGQNYFHNAFVLSMLNFDEQLFEETYNKLLAEVSFSSVFVDYFIPLLQNIGIDWQSDKITPANEHFISCLINQKLLINIERVKKTAKSSDEVYILFLPDNELHELGLLYIHYELVLQGKHSIYLGASVPFDGLTKVAPLFSKIHYISYFTVQPSLERIQDYISNFKIELLHNEDKLWLLGKNAQAIVLNNKDQNIEIFKKIEDLRNKIA